MTQAQRLPHDVGVGDSAPRHPAAVAHPPAASSAPRFAPSGRSRVPAQLDLDSQLDAQLDRLIA